MIDDFEIFGQIRGHNMGGRFIQNNTGSFQRARHQAGTNRLAVKTKTKFSAHQQADANAKNNREAVFFFQTPFGIFDHLQTIIYRG